MGLKRTVGNADRRVSGLPALRGTGNGANTVALSAPTPIDVGGYERVVVEIRLGLDRATGRLTIAGTSALRELRALRPALTSRSFQFNHEIPSGDCATIGSRVDLVA